MANGTAWKHQRHIDVYATLMPKYGLPYLYKTNHKGGHSVNMLNERIIKYNGICKECHQEALLYDERHAVVVCSKCGLVQKESTPQSITQLMEEAQKEELERKELIRKFKEQERNQMLMLNKQGNLLFNQWFYTFW